MEISNTDDIIDSREVIDRISELESELEDGPYEEFREEQIEAGIPEDEIDAFDTWLDNTAQTDHLYSLECEELLMLRALAEEGESLSDWRYGVTLIHPSHFQTYAQELAEEIGAIDPDARWPANCIDWEQAANELRVDYTTIDFDGVDYLARG